MLPPNPQFQYPWRKHRESGITKIADFCLTFLYSGNGRQSQQLGEHPRGPDSMQNEIIFQNKPGHHWRKEHRWPLAQFLWKISTSTFHTWWTDYFYRTIRLSCGNWSPKTTVTANIDKDIVFDKVEERIIQTVTFHIVQRADKRATKSGVTALTIILMAQIPSLLQKRTAWRPCQLHTPGKYLWIQLFVKKLTHSHWLSLHGQLLSGTFRMRKNCICKISGISLWTIIAHFWPSLHQSLSIIDQFAAKLFQSECLRWQLAASTTSRSFRIVSAATNRWMLVRAAINASTTKQQIYSFWHRHSFE